MHYKVGYFLRLLIVINASNIGFWGSQGGNYEGYGLVGCNSAKFGDSPKFWRNIALTSKSKPSKKPEATADKLS
jgi:hypothetical protein